MDDISEESGANFFAKMEAHVLDNGLTADVVYSNFIVNTEDYSALVGRAKTYSERIDVLETTVAAHEARITALEP